VFTEKIDMSVKSRVLNFTWEDVVAKKHQRREEISGKLL
jgi:hypothetical protein